MEANKMTELQVLEEIAKLVNYDWSDNCQDEDAQHDLYDQMLDECCTCETCGKGGSNLKDDDPIAYRCGFSDWLDNILSNEDYYEIGGEYLTPDDFETAKSEIADLINSITL